MPLPNLVIIGTHKGGTTSLHSYLSQHPQIAMSKVKELHFFSGLTWRKGEAWYSSMFEAGKVVGESSVSYTMHDSKKVAERMYSLIPEAKLIYVVRDPIDRIASHFCEVAAAFEERRDFSQIRMNWPNESGYTTPCMYHRHASHYLSFFPKERIHVLTSESLKNSPAASLKKILKYLEVEPFEFDTSSKLNESRGKRVPSAFTRKHFPEFLRRQLVLQTWLPSRIAAVIKRSILASGDRLVVPQLAEEDVSILVDFFRDDVQRFQSLFDYCDYAGWRKYNA